MNMSITRATPFASTNQNDLQPDPAAQSPGSDDFAAFFIVSAPVQQQQNPGPIFGDGAADPGGPLPDQARPIPGGEAEVAAPEPSAFGPAAATPIRPESPFAQTKPFAAGTPIKPTISGTPVADTKPRVQVADLGQPITERPALPERIVAYAKLSAITPGAPTPPATGFEDSPDLAVTPNLARTALQPVDENVLRVSSTESQVTLPRPEDTVELAAGPQIATENPEPVETFIRPDLRGPSKPFPISLSQIAKAVGSGEEGDARGMHSPGPATDRTISPPESAASVPLHSFHQVIGKETNLAPVQTASKPKKADASGPSNEAGQAGEHVPHLFSASDSSDTVTSEPNATKPPPVSLDPIRYEARPRDDAGAREANGGSGSIEPAGAPVSRSTERFEAEAGLSKTGPHVAEQVEPKLIDLAQAVRSANERGPRTLKLHLHPEELGSVEITVVRNESGSVSTTILTESEAASASLNENVQQLRESLEKAGLQVEKLEVDLRPSSSSTTGHGGSHQGPSRGRTDDRQPVAINDHGGISEVRGENELRLVNLRA